MTLYTLYIINVVLWGCAFSFGNPPFHPYCLIGVVMGVLGAWFEIRKDEEE